MSKVKLQNRGRRTITIENASFKPQQILNFPKGIAETLLKLYPNEVADFDAITADFESEVSDAEVEGKSWDDAKVADIKAHLDAGGIKYGKVLKPALVALALASEGDDVDFTALTIAELQEILEANEIKFETDANEASLIALLEGLFVK